MEIWLGEGTAGQGLEGGIAGKEKCKPGAGKGLAGVKSEFTGTNQSTREMVDINMVKCVAVFVTKWSDDLLGCVLHGSIEIVPCLSLHPSFPASTTPTLLGSSFQQQEV